MIGIILLLTVVICLLSLLIALIYVRQTEIRLTDKSVDLGDVLPIQTITEDAIINGNGDITVGYRLFLPEVFTTSRHFIIKGNITTQNIPPMPWFRKTTVTLRGKKS